MKIKIDKLRKLIFQQLKTKYSEADSKILTKIILYGELSGRT
ncbi:MAG: hypothetical protein MAG795_00088 [Candidatus Woesearchaeota archaeon]|nr:hypothetical protein [Candidatus Woesearchaeota archaeon]